MKGKQHFLPLFVGDFLASTATWEGEERALYLLLLAYQWSSGPLPADVKKLARMCQYDPKGFAALWRIVGQKFSELNGGIGNPRLEEHRARAVEISNRRANAGAKGGASSGATRQAKAEQKGQQTGSKNEAIASDLLKHPIQSDSEGQSPSARSAPSGDPPQNPRAALFAIGKTILGASSGGLISDAIANIGEPRVGKVLGEMAVSPKADPRAYFVAATRSGHSEVVV